MDELARPASQSAVGGLGSRFLLVRGPGVILCLSVLRALCVVSRVCAHHQCFVEGRKLEKL